MFKILKVRPMFTGVVTTAKCYQSDTTTEAGLLVINKKRGDLNVFQTVVAVGPMATGLKEGDIVRVNFKRYAVTKHTPGQIDIDQNIQHDDMTMSYQIPLVQINDENYLFLQNNDIEYVVEKYEVDEGGLLE